MPVIVAREVEHAVTVHIERHVPVLGQLIQEVSRIGAFVAPGAVVSAAHVRADADSLFSPTIPLAVGVEADGNDWKGISRGRSAGQHAEECAGTGADKCPRA